MAEKKVVIVLPPQGFDSRMYEGARRVWEGRRFKVTTASIARGGATSDRGNTVGVDSRVVEVKNWDCDAVIFIGGEGARVYFEEDQVHKLIKDTTYKTIGATGDAVVILAMADTLKRKKVTGSGRLAGLLEEKGAIFTNQPLQIDDKLVTVQDSTPPEQFANAIAEILQK